MRTRENREKDKVVAYLKSIGAYWFKPVQMGLGRRTVDILFCLDCVFWGCEVKARGEELTPFQRTILGEIAAAGGVAIWGDNAEAIIALIEKERKRVRVVLRSQTKRAAV